LIFFKRFTNYGALRIGIGKRPDGRLYYVNFFNQNEKTKSRYDDLPVISANKPLGDDQPPISPTGNPVAGGALSALNGTNNLPQTAENVKPAT
jgi:hypothetical protein